MTTPDLSEIVKGLTEGQKRDLTSNWDHFCDADYSDLRTDDPNYPEALEAAGYAELVPVDADALDSAFAWERGIIPGGSMWQFTPLGLEVRALLQGQQS